MVTKLDEPATDPIAYIDQVVLERQNGRHAVMFQTLSADWKVHALGYRTHRGNPEVIIAWTLEDAAKKAIRNLYSSPDDTSAQRPILEGLRNGPLQHCPACGDDGVPNTLDHYLPKQRYPEFSILPQNLIPMCARCQEEKGEDTLDAEGRRIFMHSYYDEFAVNQVVDLFIGLPYQAPESFTLIPRASLGTEERALVERHIEGLSLRNRYSHFLSTEYVRLLRSATRIRTEGLEMRQHLRLFRMYARDRAVNSWLHIFYAAVLSNDGLLDYLEHGVLPDNL